MKNANRKLIIFLGISIIFNAFFIGIISGGRMIHRPPHHGDKMHKFKRFDLLSKEEWKAHRKVIKKARKDLKEKLLKDNLTEDEAYEALIDFDNELKPIKDDMHHKIAKKAASLDIKERLELIKHHQIKEMRPPRRHRRD